MSAPAFPLSRAPHRPGGLDAVQRVRGRLIAAGVLLAGVLIAVLSGARPAYDAYGWLTWGHEALRLSLNTDAAPSWKPLTFLFTLPYALLGHAGVALWMVTAAVGAIAAPVLAARVAHRLSGRDGAAAVAALFAGLAVLDLAGFWHGVLTATADAPVAALCLGAVERHLAGRRRTAFGLLVCAALGRPEAFLFTVLYGGWLSREAPEARPLVISGSLAVVALWIGIPALTSRTPFSAGTTALTAAAPVHGNRIIAVVRSFADLNRWPVHLAALLAIVLAARGRDRRLLVLVGAAALWVLAWCGLALGGWEPDDRYLLTPAAVEAVLAGVVVGWLPRAVPRLRERPAAVTSVAALLTLALVPGTVLGLRELRNGIELGRNWSDQLGRLQAAIAASGGGTSILRCGEPVTVLTYQSVLAYDLGTNVSAVGWQPGPAIASGRPIVLYLPYVAGWHVRPIHTASGDRPRCRRLRLTTPFAYSAEFRDFLQDGHHLGRGGVACGLPGTPACRRPVSRSVGRRALRDPDLRVVADHQA